MSGSQEDQFEINYSRDARPLAVLTKASSLRFDSAKSLWTWRAIWPLMSGSGVADSCSGHSQPRSETDLRPSIGRPPNHNKRTREQQEAIISQSPAFLVEPVLLSTAEIDWQQKCAYSFLHAQTLSSKETTNEIRLIPLMNILQTITKFIAKKWKTYKWIFLTQRHIGLLVRKKAFIWLHDVFFLITLSATLNIQCLVIKFSDAKSYKFSLILWINVILSMSNVYWLQ